MKTKTIGLGVLLSVAAAAMCFANPTEGTWKLNESKSTFGDGAGKSEPRPAAVKAFWAAGIQEIYLDGSFCTEKPDPGDVDGYWVEPDEGVYDRIDPYWIDFEMILIPYLRKLKWRMWADHGVEFFIHPAMQAGAEISFPQFFRQDRDGQPRGVIQVVKATRS